MAYDEWLAERVRALLGALVDEGEATALSERKMFGGVGCMLGGRMCCGVLGDELIARVPPAAAARAACASHARPFDFTGCASAGWYYVAAEGVRTAAALRRWVALRVDVARQAPPRPAAGRGGRWVRAPRATRGP